MVRMVKSHFPMQKKIKKTCFFQAVVAWLHVDDSFVFAFFSWRSRISKKISISLCCPLD